MSTKFTWEVKRREGKMKNRFEMKDRKRFLFFSCLLTWSVARAYGKWWFDATLHLWGCPGNAPLAAGWAEMGLLPAEVFAVLMRFLNYRFSPFLGIGWWVGPLCKHFTALQPSPELVWSAQEAGIFVGMLRPPVWQGQQDRTQAGTSKKLSSMSHTWKECSLHLNFWQCPYSLLIWRRDTVLTFM